MSPEDVALAMDTLKDSATTLMFHAEMVPAEADGGGDAATSAQADQTSYQTFLDSRPPSYETRAVAEILSLAHRAPSLPLHIVHLSAAQCIPLLRAARARGVLVTAETCFHYLGLSAEEIAQGDTRHKCCPPIRDSRNRDGLWEELAAPDSCIKTVVSDHSPCTPELKLLPAHLAPSPGGTASGDFMAAWGGIASVGLGLPILHTASRQRSSAGEAATAPSLPDMVRLCCEATAAQVGLAHRKGALRAGLDADVCVFDDGEAWTVGPRDMRWKNRCSPWQGRALVGRVRETWLRARKVFELGAGDDGFVAREPFGLPVTEKRTAS